MSVLKTITIKGITQPMIHRIERVDGIGKPASGRYVIVNGQIYASEDAKNANDPISSFSTDLRGDAGEAVLAASDKDMFAACYVELKKAGMPLENGTDC
jgi:hypothetical protein